MKYFRTNKKTKAQAYKKRRKLLALKTAKIIDRYWSKKILLKASAKCMLNGNIQIVSILLTAHAA